MVPVPPAASTFGGEAAAIWHFGGVGPVVATDVDVDELQPATLSAMTARMDGSRERYRERHRASRAKAADIRIGCIEPSSASASFRAVHRVRHRCCRAATWAPADLPRSRAARHRIVKRAELQ